MVSRDYNKNTLGTLVISPSGNLYGSENVLYDYIMASSRNLDVYVPTKSKFKNKLKDKGVKTIGYKNLKVLYLKILVRLIFNPYSVLLNEGGHIRYIKLIARFLPKTKFVVVIRLLDDCNSHLKDLPKNIRLIAVSNYIKDHIYNNAKVIYDPYKNQSLDKIEIARDYFIAGIVGRVSESKGLNYLLPILESIEYNDLRNIRFVFFGSYNPNDLWFKNFIKNLNNVTGLKYSLEGFVGKQQRIYADIDILIHLNKQEALGRIVFEAVDYNVPFLAFDKGGVGELSSLLMLDTMLVADTENWQDIFAEKLLFILNNKDVYQDELLNASILIEEKFSRETYCVEVEKLL